MLYVSGPNLHLLMCVWLHDILTLLSEKRTSEWSQVCLTPKWSVLKILISIGLNYVGLAFARPIIIIIKIYI